MEVARDINKCMQCWFKTSNLEHIIEVKLYDEIDFVCPHFHRTTDPTEYEFYIIHQVSKSEYEDCNIFPDKKSIMIVNCSQPNQKKRFTLLFEPFHSIPNVPEFKQGGTYYFITTSTGTQDGLANPTQGACLHRNMKVTIKVCCASTTTETTLPQITHKTWTISSSTQPQGASQSTTTTTTTTTVSTTTTSRDIGSGGRYGTSTKRWQAKTTTRPPDRPPPRVKPTDKLDDKDVNKQNELTNKHMSDINGSQILQPSIGMVLASTISLLAMYYYSRLSR